VTRKIYDFSPEQQQNLLAIVWLYRGETQRYLELVSDYCDRTLKEGVACFANDGRDGASADPLQDFLATIAALRDMTGPSPQTPGTDSEHDVNGGAHRELADALRTFEADAAALRKRLAKRREAWKQRKAKPAQWGALKRAVDSLAPLAEAGHDLARQADLLYKLATRLTETGGNARNAKSNGTRNARDAARARKAADAARLRLVGQLKQVRYFQRQAHWLTERFPKAELRDVAGLVKLVSRAEIAANDWSLTPGRYVGVAPEEEDEDFDFEETLREIHVELEDLNAEATTLAATIKKSFEGLGI